MSIVAIVLTFNEEKHIERCLRSIMETVDRIVVVDCYSTDNTAKIAKKFGAEVLYNKWVNHANQFNWALNNIGHAEWVLRIDADEVITKDLAGSLKKYVDGVDKDIEGFYINRRIFFLGEKIKYGGIFPVKILRLFRYGAGECENRWMDEHIIVSGKTESIKEEIHDINLNTLTWWIDKHNKYASLEALEVLVNKHNINKPQTNTLVNLSGQAGLKRLIKNKIYNRLPIGIRAFAYFFYRFFIRLGFLDGAKGTVFHILQGFWYRYLVDAKIYEVENHAKNKSVTIEQSIVEVLKIKMK